MTQVFLSDLKTTRFIPCVHLCESHVVNSIIYGAKVLQIWRFVETVGKITSRRKDTSRFPVETIKNCLNLPEKMTDLLVQKSFKVHKAIAITNSIMTVFHVSIRRKYWLNLWH